MSPSWPQYVVDWAVSCDFSDLFLFLLSRTIHSEVSARSILRNSCFLERLLSSTVHCESGCNSGAAVSVLIGIGLPWFELYLTPEVWRNLVWLWDWYSATALLLPITHSNRFLESSRSCPNKLFWRGPSCLMLRTEVSKWSFHKAHSQATKCHFWCRRAHLSRPQGSHNKEFLFKWNWVLLDWLLY